MSYSNKRIVTRDELVEMLDAMNIDKVEVEECYGGSLEVFVHAKEVEVPSQTAWWEQNAVTNP